jgi:uncharacterized protein (DUF58 family)
LTPENDVSIKVAVLGSFSVLSFIFGLFLSNALIFASIPAVVYLALVFVQRDSSPRADVKIVRTLERAQLSEGDVSKVRLRVTNVGKKSIAFLTIKDAVPRDLEDQSGPEASFSMSLKPGESTDRFYSLRANNFGVFWLGPIKTIAEDSFGFGRSEETVNVVSAVVVLPRTTEKLLHFKIRPRKTKPWPGEIVAKRVGLGMDNYSIRQYIPGDSFRRINWRATARAGTEEEQLLLNEQSAELGADTIVILDARPVSNIVSAENESLVSHSVRAAISITDKLLRDRNRVGLVTIGLDTHRIAPGYGRRQYNRLVLSLIRVRVGGFFTFENIPSYLKFFYPHLAQVVIISPLIDWQSLNAAAEIARSGYELLVISPNPHDFSPVRTADSRSNREKERTLSIALSLAELSRKANLEELRNANVFVLDWKKDEPLDYVLSKNIRAWGRQAELTRRNLK